MVSRAQYGSKNVNDGMPANGNIDAWGGWQWPVGVPDRLLGTTDYTTRGGQRLRVQMRVELVPLWDLLFELADRKHGYTIWTFRDGESWGPWGYGNRPISGTTRPSGHSAGLSVDINAPLNPYSTTFESDMPPAMVADFEACGLYWGGRYEGQKYDPMHFGYCCPPANVAGHIAKARALLAAATGPSNPTNTEDDDVATLQELLTKTPLIPYGKGGGMDTFVSCLRFINDKVQDAVAAARTALTDESVVPWGRQPELKPGEKPRTESVANSLRVVNGKVHTLEDKVDRILRKLDA